MLIQDREIIINYKDSSTVYLTIEQNEDDTFELEQFSEWCDVYEYIENIQTKEFMNSICEYVEEKYGIKFWCTTAYVPNSEEITDGVLLYINLGFK